MILRNPSGIRMRWSRLTRRRHAFTLIEMMVVLAITLVLLGMSWYVAGSVVSGSSVDSGARTVNSQLRLARSYAVSKRQYVALLMPNTGDLSSLGLDAQTQFGGNAVRPCLVTINGSTVTFDSYIEGGEWSHAPRSVTIRITEPSASTDWTRCADVPFPQTGDSTLEMYCVVFKPTGQLFSASDDMEITAEPLHNADADQSRLHISWLTGKVSYVR